MYSSLEKIRTLCEQVIKCFAIVIFFVGDAESLVSHYSVPRSFRSKKKMMRKVGVTHVAQVTPEAPS
jgi:hypothetical protein